MKLLPLSISQMSLALVDLYQGRPLVTRSPRWSQLRKEFVQSHPVCAVCGYRKQLNVHHIIPFHVAPTLELEPTNLITLGEACPTGNHHLVFGHLGNWQSYNLKIVPDAELFFHRLSHRPSIPYKV